MSIGCDTLHLTLICLVRQPPPYLFFIRNFLTFAGEGWRNTPPESPNNTSYYYEESILSFGSLLPTYPI